MPNDTYIIAGIELCDDDFNGKNNENSKSTSMINKNCEYIYDNIKPKSNQFVDKELIDMNKEGGDKGILRGEVTFIMHDNNNSHTYSVTVPVGTEVVIGDLESDTGKSTPAIAFVYNKDTTVVKMVGGKRKSQKRAKKVKRRRTHRRN